MNFFLSFFFVESQSVDYYYGHNGYNIRPTNPSGTIDIHESIFHHFHNINKQQGGCIYIYDDTSTVKFTSLGFVDCFSENEGGALNIRGKSIQIQRTCAFLCEAFDNSYQFSKFECVFEQSLNRIQYLTVVNCGYRNSGRSAVGISGRGRFSVNYLNSSRNINKFDSNSYGTCFRTHDIVYHQTNYVNFLNSEGTDVFNTHFIENTTYKGTGTFNYGNVYNCTTTYIFKFRGVNSISNFRFSNLRYYESFVCGAGYKSGHSLTFADSKIDHFPFGIDPVVNIKGGCGFENPISFMNIPCLGTDYCRLPTHVFSKSEEFTKSAVFSPTPCFTHSSKFTASKTFSPSEKFTSSRSFSHSKVFTSSMSFSPSKVFTSSKSFSPSKVFTSSKSFSPSNVFTSSKKFSPSSKFTKSKTFSPSSKFTSSGTFSPSKQFSSSKTFTPSKTFTSSKTFSPSSKFTSSKTFSQSSKFTSSGTFSPSSKFTLSNTFSPSEKRGQTNTFTPSSQFTPSFTFKPNATKYPDGLSKFGVHVTGKKADNSATPAQIGATAGVSFTFIGVAVFLMILYLRNKRRQLQERDEEFSDSVLENNSQSSTYSYSYSYYTYEYYYSYNEGSYEYQEYDENNTETEMSYSDFDGLCISLED